MHTVKQSNNYEFNIGTLDLETYIENNEHKVLCAVFYDGNNFHKFYIADYVDQDSMIDALLDTILQPNNHKLSIYMHNGSAFDLVFLLKSLSKRTLKGLVMDPIIKDGKFLNIKMTFKGNGNEVLYVNFKDSILLSSLSKLAKQFKLEDKMHKN